MTTLTNEFQQVMKNPPGMDAPIDQHRTSGRKAYACICLFLLTLSAIGVRILAGMKQGDRVYLFYLWCVLDLLRNRRREVAVLLVPNRSGSET